MRKHLKDYFIPHDGNGYKPHSLQKAALAAMTLMVMLTFALTNLQALLWLSSDWLISTVLPAVIVDLTNEERTEDSLGQLRRNVLLDEAARMKAEDMARNKYFSHYSPTGVSPWHWFAEADYNFVHAGENLAIHFTDSGDVVEAWMNSPTHRANIVNPNYTEIGVGTAEGSYEGFSTVFVVQLFGTPAASSFATTPPEPEPAVPVAIAAEPAVAGEEITESDSTDQEVLSEAVDITETVEIKAAEPVAVPATDNPVPEMDTVVDYVDNDVVVYSDHMATTVPGVPASLTPIDSTAGTTDKGGFFGRIATKPHLILQVMYALLAAFVLFSLTLAIVIEWRTQHPVQLAYSVALLLLMYGLYKVHLFLSAGAIIV